MVQAQVLDLLTELVDERDVGLVMISTTCPCWPAPANASR